MQTPHPDRHREDDPYADDRSTALGPPTPPAYRLARRVWNPTPVPKPAITTDLEQLSWPERSAEVVRHALLSAEHWLSRGGWLREWIRLNLWLGVVLIVSALLIVPAVTALLAGVRDWTRLLRVTIGNINMAVATLPPIILALATAFLVVKLIQRHRAGQRQQRRPPYDHYE